jgi:hypothetical protein
MHQMHISINQVSLLMLRSKKLEIRKKKCEDYKIADKNQAEWYEIEPYPSKDRAMHEGDNPWIWDEFIKFAFFLTVQFKFVF